MWFFLIEIFLFIYFSSLFISSWHSQDYKCPLCSEGFIEELPSATENPEQAEPENDAPYIRFANDLLQSNSLSSPSMTDSPYFRLGRKFLIKLAD
jgi:hypothetical protein